MAKKLISFNFNGKFCDELSALTRNYPLSEVETKYCTTAPSRMTEYATDTYLAEAIANYIGSICTMHLFVGKGNKGEYVCEYRKNGHDDTQICVGKINADGRFSFKAGIMDEHMVLHSFEPGHKGTQFVMAMFPTIIMDSEAMSFLDILKNYSVEEDAYSTAMCGLSNNIYYRLKDEKSTNPVKYEHEVSGISQTQIEKIEISKVHCGKPQIFTCLSSGSTEEEVAATAPSVLKGTDIRDMILLDEDRVLTEEEEKRVPDLGDWFVVPNWSMKTAKRVVNSQRFRKSIKNMLIHGPSGSGKSESCKAMAEAMGLPYASHTGSPDDDYFSTVSQILPNTEKGNTKNTEERCKELDIPSFEDIENNFDASFEKLFGRKPDKFDSEADAYKEVTNRLLESSTGEDADFIHVESEIIAAIKNGWFLEIQEANIIKRASVLESLNPLLQGDGFLKLPNGEIVRRHPDCVIAFTINRDYEGTQPLNEAVLSRMNLVIEAPEPTEEELFARTKAQTMFANDIMLRKMAKVVCEIHEYCREKDITGGVCGPRELMDWAVLAILESEDREEEKISETSVIIAALQTILAKVAQNSDDIEDVITGVFCKHFSPAKVNECRK